MSKKIIIISICLALIVTTIPRDSWGLDVDPDIGTDNPTIDSYGSGSGSCTGLWWARIACVAGQVARYMRTIQRITSALEYVPHSFPFGGPILKSERACTFRFNSWTSFPNPFYPCFPIWCPGNIVAGPIPVPVPLGGRAIVVGPPVPTYPDPGTFDFSTGEVPPGGWVIAFPWISNIYRHHTENRAGPWALGLGFSPFPLDDINESLSGIRIWIPPNPLDPPCSALLANWLLPPMGAQECIDNIRFDCRESGEQDASGNDIYKVIRKLGTSRENAPTTAFPTGFTLP